MKAEISFQHNKDTEFKKNILFPESKYETRDPRSWSRARAFFTSFIVNPFVQIYLAFNAISFTYGPPSIMILYTNEVDNTVAVISVCFLLVFITELIANLLLIENYMSTIFFLLDIVSIISFILDLKWIDSLIFEALSYEAVIQKRKLVRSSGASRAGLRLTNLMRLIFLVWMKIMFDRAKKLMKIKGEKKVRRQLDSSKFSPYYNECPPESINTNCIKQTSMGNQMFMAINQNYIFVVLFTLICLLFIDYNVYFQPQRSIDFSLKTLSQMQQNGFSANQIANFCNNIKY